MKLVIALAIAGVAGVAALLVRGPVSRGTGLVVVMHAAAFLVFAALWWVTHDRKRRAALVAGLAVAIGLAGAWAYLGPRAPLASATAAELVGSYQLARSEAPLEIALLPDGTFTHGLLQPSSARVQRGRWQVFHRPGKPHATVSFDGYAPACVVPDEQCELARYMGQALSSGLYEAAEVCRLRGRMALCFDNDEYVRR